MLGPIKQPSPHWETIAGIALVEVSSAHVIAACSPGAEQLYGCVRKGLVGRPYGALFPAEAGARGAAERHLSVASAAGSTRIEEWRVRQDGVLFRFSGTLASMPSCAGGLPGFLETGHDSTAEYLTNQRLEQSERLLEQLLAAMPEAVLLMDRDGRVLLSNPSAHGTGLHPSATGTSDLANSLQIRRALRTGETLSLHAIELPHSRRRFDATISPLSNAAGQALVILRPSAGAAHAASSPETGGRVLEIQEAERRRLARDLHDETGQVLARLRTLLDGIAKAHGDEVAAPAIAALQEVARSIGEISHALRPAVLDDLGLIPALQWLRGRFAAGGLAVDVSYTGPDDRPPPELETAAYRIVQEALTNAARHARVEHAVVRVWLDDRVLGLQVEDQGHGFCPAEALAAGKVTGVAGMRDRALLLGGSFTVDSAAGEGTRIVVELPLSGEGAARR